MQVWVRYHVEELVVFEGLGRQARGPVREVPPAAAPGDAPGEVGVGGHPEEGLPNVDDLDADPHVACVYYGSIK